MNSTEKLQAMTARLIELAKALQAQGKAPFWEPIQAEKASYYQKPDRSMMEGADFRAPDLSTEAFFGYLERRWKSEGLSELVALIPDLKALAEELRPVSEQSEDLSPFQYVLF